MSHGGMAASVRRRAHIDLDAFTSNLRVLLSRDAQFVLDARANAYGHGLGPIVAAALATGVTTVRVSPDEAELAGTHHATLTTEPSAGRLVAAEAYGLDGHHRPVMTLMGEVIAVKPTEAGAGVSYGYSYHTVEPTTLALVALGYADGVPRLASNRARVAIAGHQYPLVGRVAMDQFVVDCGASVPAVGDEVVLFGPPTGGAPTTIAWAEWTERSPLHLTAGIGSRVERQYS